MYIMMKKTILTFVTAFVSLFSAQAQTWNMIVTHEDGSTDTIPTAKVKNVSFSLPDQNADQILIKELYNGGCLANDGVKTFTQDQGVVLYNNCSQVAVANNLGVGFAGPYNSAASNNWYTTDGQLSYSDYIPALMGIWYFQTPLIIQPYSQVVISFKNAIDNTQTYSNSVNYANKDYYTTYDPESGFNQTSSYAAPADVIPTSHYLKAVEYGQGTAWALSVVSPAFFIFQTQNVTPAVYANNTDNIIYDPGKTGPVYANLKVPTSWILDGIEVYNAGGENVSKKRLTADIDAGYVSLTNKLGHTLYRNVDKEATEALPENAGKLVYNYALGVGNSTDPSGIDAEASIKQGAHIIYQDTNNSTNDFHERQKFSIRGE